MKASELRIRNLVEYNTGEEEGWVKNVVNDLDTLHISQNPQLYRPIPITQELVNGLGIDIIINEQVVGCIIEINDEWDIHLAFFEELTVSLSPPNVKLPHIQYVHQLQNLYHALTGEELEIKG